MREQLPPPNEIADHYNTILKELKGDYIHSRWEDAEIKRRHYRQTERALRFGLDRVARLGEVLEVGCGPAVWTPLFLAGSERVHLLDISEEMLKEASARIAQIDGGRHASKVRTTCGDFLQVRDDARYDTIVSARAFEYMSDKPAFVRKCFELLRPGGSLLVVTKNRNWRDLRQTAINYTGVPREQIPVGIAMHLDCLDAGTAERMLSSANFADVAAYPAVIGSYDLPLFTKAPGLFFSDTVHWAVHRRPLHSLPRWVDSLTESYLVLGTRR